LQSVVNEAGRRRALVIVPHVTKGASFRGHLNLNPHELSRPFADQISDWACAAAAPMKRNTANAAEL
jgi:hypothetical protein